ncbi:immunity 21 family protein [Streptomyces sp. NBC_01317]|uniref:Imm21 family immunity protein n=1 Tax=Streptomyces sp. NBC_01317 TaxID=2903822 RepID=UPI002E147E1A|nr:immunity 21 family protein [Streptomyces sp. NBC_01317]
MTGDSEVRRDGEELRWIESSGGPFVVLPASRLTHWLGSNGSDYEAACEVEEYLGLVRVGAPELEATGLVVADEPLPAVYIPDLKCVLQWQYAPSESALVSAARRSIEGVLDWQVGPVFDIRDRVVMFDAAASGETLEASEMLELPLPPGKYECFTADYSEGRDTAGRLHQFRPVNDFTALPDRLATRATL